MRDYGDIVGICVLGCVAVGALAIMGLCAGTDKRIPAEIGAAFGTAVGAISGLLSPRNRRNGQ